MPIVCKKPLQGTELPVISFSKVGSEKGLYSNWPLGEREFK